MYEINDYVGTFWRSIDRKYKYSVFAVVFQNGNSMTAWEIEMRGENIYHPAYGVLPKSDAEGLNMFIPEHNHKIPMFSFSANESGFYYAGTNLDKILWLPII